MASSADDKTCFNCKTASDELRPGWGRRFGDYVMLCDRCASAYEDGSFCSTFHLDATGWRVCATCNRPVHCGCIMSAHTHTILDFGGVRCMDCVLEIGLVTHRQNLTGPSEVGQSATFPPPGSRVTYALPNKMILKLASGVAPAKNDTLHGVEEEEPSVNSPDETDSLSDKEVEQPQKSITRRAHVHSQNIPKRSNEEWEQLSKGSKSVFIPFFEKELTTSDTEAKNGRLVLPERCAEAYLPKVTKQQRVPIMVQDTSGRNWQFYYRMCSNSNGKMYVLEGLKEYLNMIQWQAGDKVIFYWREPEGNLVMGISRAEAGKSGQKSSA